jgi:hypothetical protein
LSDYILQTNLGGIVSKRGKREDFSHFCGTDGGELLV